MRKRWACCANTTALKHIDSNYSEDQRTQQAFTPRRINPSHASKIPHHILHGHAHRTVTAASAAGAVAAGTRVTRVWINNV